jgi:hypothetical protein
VEGVRTTRSTLLGGLWSPATWGNAGPYSGGCKIHGKDGVAGSISAGTPHKMDRETLVSRPFCLLG